MCCKVSLSQTRVEEPMLVWKIVHESKFGVRRSQYSPIDRGLIEGFKDYGDVLSYPLGAKVVSPAGPGIMVFPDETMAHSMRNRFCSNWDSHPIIQLRVPAGAMVREGTWHGVPILCASEVEVLS